MNAFNDKEKATENKYAHDKETEFKVHARRNRLFGLWAASKIGLEGPQAEEYAKIVTTVDLGKLNDQAVFEKVKADLVAKNISMSDHDIHAEMHHSWKKAKEQVESGL